MGIFLYIDDSVNIEVLVIKVNGLVMNFGKLIFGFILFVCVWVLSFVWFLFLFRMMSFVC